MSGTTPNAATAAMSPEEAEAATIAIRDKHHHCNDCDISYPDWHALQKHRLQKFRQDGSHVHCHLCGMTFFHVGTLVMHLRQTHPAEQDLNCPGCDEHFNRVGTLMYHIEKNQCRNIRKVEVDARRREKLDFANELEKRSAVPLSFRTYIASSAEPSTAPDTDEGNKVSFNSGDFPDLPPRGPGKENDHALSPYEGRRVVDVTSNYEEEDWGTTSKDQVGSASGSGDTWFPKGWSSEKEDMGRTILFQEQNDKEMYPLGIHDPKHPHFDVNYYYDESTRTWCCPMDGCFDAFPCGAWLTKHLTLAGRHGVSRLQCPYCLRLFKNVTALVQHAESQSVRCNLRNTSQFRPFMDQLTGGIVDAGGRNLDSTIKYTINEEAIDRFSRKSRLERMFDQGKHRLGPSRTHYVQRGEPADIVW